MIDPHPECTQSMSPEAMEAAWSAVRQRHERTIEAVREIAAESGDELRPGSREFLAVLDEVRQLHLAKTLDYGVASDALSNIRQSAEVVNMPAWSACVVRMADKMHRLKAFHHRGKTEFDGVPDTLLDLCSYAALALVLYREQAGS
ncbi:MAG: hypothetical protein EBR82_31205 [Caulobacteraceae bacterium]|nr:hypothetical protein [Caulobacteraceae bacterium]